MAFNYNGTSPTAIKYNGTDLTVLKYGSTAVWGKPYSLSISAGSNTSITVNRTSSPNQHASTGTLSSGSVIYYGDVLTISYSVSSGYKISTSTVNGTTFSSGASFTVTGAISVVTTAVASASWRTVWTGSYSSRNFSFDSTSSSLKTQTVQATKFKNLQEGARTKVTLKFGWYEENNWTSSTQTVTLDNGGNAFYNQVSWNTNGTSSDFTLSTQSGSYCCIGIGKCGGNGTTGYITLIYTSLYGGYSYQITSVTITQIDQYY